MTTEPDTVFIRAAIKIVAQIAVGACNVWATTFELMENMDEQAVLPQHFIIYTESKPNFGVGDQMGLKIGKGLVD